MVMRTVRIGALTDAVQYDDGDYSTALETTQPLAIGAPAAPGHAARIDDVQMSWPVGSIFFSAVATNPGTLFGFGTWVRIAEGQMIVGFKTGDPDFGVLKGTGGNKTTTHDNNHSGGSAAISVQPTAHVTVVINDPGAGVPTTVLTDTNNHSGTDVSHSDPDAHSDHNILNPFIVLYVWERTA